MAGAPVEAGSWARPGPQGGAAFACPSRPDVGRPATFHALIPVEI